MCFEKMQPKCPNCGVVYGDIVGDQPEGSMAWWQTRESLPGYEGCGTLEIWYQICDGVQTVSGCIAFESASTLLEV